jgi:CRP-like cAMP-binding protein
MAEPLLFKKLEAVADLTAEDRAEFQNLISDVRTVEAKRDIVRDGERPEHVHLMVEGWAARYKMLENGSRQIMALLIPGDFCDLHLTVIGRMDHGIVALSKCSVARIDSEALDRVLETNARLTKAILWSALVDEAITRQCVINVGRRDAYQRVAHILCEMHARMKMVGLVDDNVVALPLTQEMLADATGLTPVHINRTIALLRKDRLFEIGNGMLKILDIGALASAGGFDAGYLQLQRRAPRGK